jgi:signal transduction histidine kinase/CheY-like chemotaxis protein
MTLLITAILASFLWAAATRVEATLVRAAGDRMQRAADQVASFVGQSLTLDSVSRAAATPALAAYLETPTPENRKTVETLFAGVASSNAPRRVELWNAAGERVFAVGSKPPSSGSLAGFSLPEMQPGARDGVQPLREAGGHVFVEMVGPIEKDGRRLGQIAVGASFSITPPGILGRLVGSDGIVTLGNKEGGVWTDLTSTVTAPPVDVSSPGVETYTNAAGERRIGASADIPNTPWVAWAEMPRDVLVGPARDFLITMLPVAVIFLGAFAIVARIMSTRLTRPLFELSDAALKVATGDYSSRVPVRRRDEVGRLAEAFNAMTSEIAGARTDLEARVEARTRELAAARQEADKANRAKSEFLSLMSHDLRTPLNAILGFAQLLESENLTRDQAEHVSQILAGGRHLLDLISEVLDITRIETGQLPMSLEPVSVREIVMRQVDLVRPIAADRRVTFEVGALDSADAVMADRQRLRQILLNLFSNAVKYNRERGHVVVTGGPVEGGRYRITVTDTGAGIPDVKMQRLFQPFERLGAEQTGIEGTGLGLALSKALAEAMGGSLGATSVVDSGSTFWVDLKQSDKAVAQAAHEAVRSVEQTPTAGGTVLYIEDNRSNVKLVERILQRRPGVVLVHAPNGEAGIALCRSRRPDLVLLDLHLPDMSGEDVLGRLWADPGTRAIPKIVVTADATPGLGRRLESEGAVAVMTKPLNVQEMLSNVDRILGNGRKAAGVG